MAAFSKCASSKSASPAGRTGRYLSCERAQTVCRKRGGGRPRKNGRGGGSPAATRRPRHLVTLGARPRPAAQSVMHVSLSKYLRKAAPTPPGLAPFFCLRYGARLGGPDCNVWPIRVPSVPVGHFLARGSNQNEQISLGQVSFGSLGGLGKPTELVHAF